jgi:hypothetical protein
MIRSEALDARIWAAIVEHVISDAHIEEALAAPDRGTNLNPATTATRLESRLRQLARAEEILLDRFGRGLITDSALDKQLVRLKRERTEIERSMLSAQQALTAREAASESARVMRKAISDLRGRLRIATTHDRRDIVRAIVARGENAVKIGPERIDAQLLLAARSPAAFAPAYAAG